MSRSAKVQKYALKARQRQRKAQARAIAAETDAKRFQYLSRAGTPGGGNTISSRAWGAGTYTGWIAEEYVAGWSSDFRAREIKKNRYYYQFPTGDPSNLSMKPGKKMTRVQYKSADNWQREINAAYWGKTSKEAHAADLRSKIPIAPPASSSHWSYVSGSSYIDSYSQGSNQGGSRGGPKPPGPSGPDVVIPGTPPFGGGRGNTTKLPGWSDFVVKSAWSKTRKMRDEEEKAKEQNPTLTSSTASPAFATAPKTWTQLVADSSVYGGVKVDPSVIDEVLGKPKLGAEGKPTDWVSYWNQAEERSKKSGSDATVGVITGFYDQKMKEKQEQSDWYDQQIGKYKHQDPKKRLVGDKSLEQITSELDWLAYAKSEKSKVDADITRLSKQKRELQTSEQVLAEAGRINEDTKARKAAKDVIKHYDPVGVNYLDPEGVEGYYRKFIDQEQLLEQTVRAQYTKFLSPTTQVYRTSKGTTIFETEDGHYSLSQQERQEFEDISRLHKGYAHFQGLDPDKPITHMRRRKILRETQKFLPKMQAYIDIREDKLKELYADKKESNEQYSKYTTRISKLATDKREKWRSSGGKMSSSEIYDRDFISELQGYAQERESLRYTIAKYEAERDMMKKNLKETEEQQSELKKQLKDMERQNLAHGGGGGFLRPNRYAPQGSTRYHGSVGAARIKQAGRIQSAQVYQRQTQRGGTRQRRTRSGLGGLVV